MSPPVRLFLKIRGFQMENGKVSIFQMPKKLNIIRNNGNYLEIQGMNWLRMDHSFVGKTSNP